MYRSDPPSAHDFCFAAFLSAGDGTWQPPPPAHPPARRPDELS